MGRKIERGTKSKRGIPQGGNEGDRLDRTQGCGKAPGVQVRFSEGSRRRDHSITHALSSDRSLPSATIAFERWVHGVTKRLRVVFFRLIPFEVLIVLFPASEVISTIHNLCAKLKSKSSICIGHGGAGDK